MIKLLNRYQDIISSFNIEKFEQFGASLRLRAKVKFNNNSILYVRETVIEGRFRKYSYHWQDEKGELIIRWDNAPDWDIETHPHHKHVDDKVELSYERNLEQVLKIIAKELR